MRIIATVKPPNLAEGTGCLVFTDATNGRFSVKLAYRALYQTCKRPGIGSQPHFKPVWDKIC